MRNQQTSEVPIKVLVEVIHNLHGCKALWAESVPIKETHEGDTVWEGEVQVFSLSDHPTATRCYAWSYETENGKRKFFAVLHQGPVNSPQAAVRAAIVAEYREREE